VSRSEGGGREGGMTKYRSRVWRAAAPSGGL